MMTLQDIIDAALTCPERYGRQHWFLVDKGVRIKPICPLAQEVLSDFVGTPEEDNELSIVAQRLDCHIGDVEAFVDWWDQAASCNESRAFLLAVGYRLP